MTDPKPAIKKRFLEVVRLIISKQLEGVDNEAQFAEAINVFPQQVYHIRTQPGRHVTIEMIHNTCKVFGINANYIISGELPVQKTKDSAADKIRKIEKILRN